MALPSFKLDNINADFGATATGASFGNIDGPTWGGGGKGFLASGGGAGSPLVGAYLAPVLAGVAVLGVVYVLAKGK